MKLLLVIASIFLYSSFSFAASVDFCKFNKSAYEALLTEQLRQKLPYEKLDTIFKDYQKQFGECVSFTEVEKGKYRLQYEKATVPTSLYYDQDKIGGIWFGQETLTQDSWEEIGRDFKKLAGKKSLYVIEEGKSPLVAIDETQPLALASTSKLYVLRALYDAIDAKKVSLDQVVKIDQSLKTLPSGVLQEWPNHSPVTVDTLANLMISKSDNTATDHLIALLGREVIEKISPQNTPYLLIGDSFKLESQKYSNYAKEYKTADVKKRRQILETIAKLPMTRDEYDENYQTIDYIGWFASTKSLCQVIFSLKKTPSLSINPGVAKAKDWASIGFKGGSQPGVFQLTHLLQHPKTKKWFCVSATVNDRQEVDQKLLSSLTVRSIDLLL